MPENEQNINTNISNSSGSTGQSNQQAPAGIIPAITDVMPAITNLLKDQSSNTQKTQLNNPTATGQSTVSSILR